jgi:hypothetical protein
MELTFTLDCTGANNNHLESHNQRRVTAPSDRYRSPPRPIPTTCLSSACLFSVADPYSSFPDRWLFSSRSAAASSLHSPPLPANESTDELGPLSLDLCDQDSLELARVLVVVAR